MAYLTPLCPLKCRSRKNNIDRFEYPDEFDIEAEEFEDIILLNCSGCKENLGAKFKEGSKAGIEYIKRMRSKYE